MSIPQTKIILQPIVAGKQNGDQTESKLLPQVTLAEDDFLTLADYGQVMSVNGQPTTVYAFNRGRYVVAGEVSE